jgi:hypothetical protein
VRWDLSRRLELSSLALASGGRIITRPVLGGLLYEYERKAE